MEDAVVLLNREYMKSFRISKEDRASDLRGIVDYLKDYCLTHAVLFVHGRGKRKSVHQRYLELFQKFLDRQLLYDLHHSRFGSRNSYSKTDPDATFMRMKDDHMRNGQLKPAYNVQIAVNSEYITGVDVFSNRTDFGTLIPFLKQLQHYHGAKYEEVTADAGYESEENYLYLDRNGQLAFIKPTNFEISKTRSYRSDISRKENMQYDEERDVYICRNSFQYMKITKAFCEVSYMNFYISVIYGHGSISFP